MGKLLIIKDVNFSTNCVEWAGDPTPGPTPPTPTGTTYVWAYGLTDTQLATTSQQANMSTAGYTHQDQTPIRGKYISGIKFNCKLAGVVSIWIYDGILATGPLDTTKIIEKTSVTLTQSTGIQSFRFDQPFLLGSNQTLIFGAKYNSGAYGYGSTNIGTGGCFTTIYAGGTVATAGVYLGVDVEILE